MDAKRIKQNNKTKQSKEREKNELGTANSGRVANMVGPATEKALCPVLIDCPRINQSKTVTGSEWVMITEPRRGLIIMRANNVSTRILSDIQTNSVELANLPINRFIETSDMWGEKHSVKDDSEITHRG